jgi:hypothetical protein
MFLLCYDPTAPVGPDDPPTLQPQHAAIEREAREKGVYVSGAALWPVNAKKRFRMRGETVLPTDGPFAETREAVGGYFIIECEDDADARRWASKIANSSRGWVEPRRVVLFHPDAERISQIAARSG